MYVWEGPAKAADPSFRTPGPSSATPSSAPRSQRVLMRAPSGGVTGSSPPRGSSPGSFSSRMDAVPWDAPLTTQHAAVGSWDGRGASFEPQSSFATPLRGRRGSTASMAAAPVVPVRVDGIKRVAAVAVGEKHSLALQTWCSQPAEADGSPMTGAAAVLEDGPPPLQSLCQATIARDVVDLRNVLHVLEFAESLDAAVLRDHCLLVVVANLDAVVGETRAALEMLSPHLVCEVERLYKARLHPASAVEGADGVEEVPCLQPGLRPTRVAVERADNAEEMLLEAASLARCKLHESTQAALRAAMAGTGLFVHSKDVPSCCGWISLLILSTSVSPGILVSHAQRTTPRANEASGSPARPALNGKSCCATCERSCNRSRACRRCVQTAINSTRSSWPS